MSTSTLLSTSTYQESPRDRMELLVYLLAVIGDLCNPDPQLLVDRDKLATVLDWIQREMSVTLNDLTD